MKNREMTTMPIRLLLSVALTAVIAAPAAAQTGREKVSFRNVRVGYPPGPHNASPDEAVLGNRPPMFKAGAWTPILVDIQNTGRYDPATDGPAIVSVDVADSDDTLNTYSAPLPQFDEGGSASVILYTRPGSHYADITVRVQAKGRDICTPRQTSYSGLDANQLLYLALGSRLPGLKTPGGPSSPQPMGATSRAEVGLITRIVELPPLWFGYGSADVVILATSDRDFISGLVSDQSGRRAALAEWVRRGGKLIVCAGKNRDQFAGAPELLALLPMTVEGPYVAQEAALKWIDGGGASDDSTLANADGKPVEFTKLSARPDRPARVLMEGPTPSPLVVQAAYGLGRVTLVAFDPDVRPVLGWKGEANFWEQLLRGSGPGLATTQTGNQFGNLGGRYGGDQADEALLNYVNRLDQFEGVPVISFGWVALFILLYILVVGPLDYLFLKKVVKRLELTWITFPTVVLAVSAGAYFTAYHLKGSDLRINRIDVVDYDYQTKQAYGRSYLSIFSPRIQKYTIGFAPSEGWAGAPDDAATAGTVVSWFGTPKIGRQSFFRHSYEYARNAEGLLSVPINVWSTKGFQGEWVAPLDKDKPPFMHSVTHPPTQPTVIAGSVTNNLPVDLEDAILIYKGSVINLGTMLPGVPKVVSAGEPKPFRQWMQGGDSSIPEAGEVPRVNPGVSVASGPAQRLDVSVLFHEAAKNANEFNNGAMRDLDQSWRVSDANKDEVILVARLKQAQGAAQDINSGANNPSRLWLGKLPSDRKSNGQAEDLPQLQGTMRQDVYVRAFIPVVNNATRP
jgi:hypothetical protein